MNESNIYPIWQPVGYSTHVIAAKLSEKLKTKTSHTGTLDPMAEGVVIILAGEERLKKYEYAAWEKEYVFGLVLGLSTDSGDALGIVDRVGAGGKEEDSVRAESVLFSDGIHKSSFCFPGESFAAENITQLQNIHNDENIFKILKSMEGPYVQEVPVFSAIKVKGKPLHWHARQGKPDYLSLPKRKGTIISLELMETGALSTQEMVNTITGKIEKVTGDLRQEEVKAQWQRILPKLPDSLPLLKIKARVTKGLYIRSLAQDISQKVKTPGFVYSLVRTKNGEYAKSQSKTLEETFGSDFGEKYNFVSGGSA